MTIFRSSRSIARSARQERKERELQKSLRAEQRKARRALAAKPPHLTHQIMSSATEQPSDPYVNLHAQERWRERVQPSAARREPIEALKRIVDEGQEITDRPSWMGQWSPGEHRYYVHADWPGLVAVVARSTFIVITVAVAPKAELQEAIR